MVDDIEKGGAGSSFDSFLEEEGILDETREIAIKRVIAFQLAEIMKDRGISKVEMAARMDTSRSQLDRLLDPDNDKVTLSTLTRAANVVGRKLTLQLS